MPWNLNDYPSSLKNLSHPTRKKAIDIANALVDEGYEEGRAIPIATEQAKEWHENASRREIEQYEKQGKPEKRQTDQDSRPELLDKDVLIMPQEDDWEVKTKTAKKASKVFSSKNEAIDYARSLAKNKQTRLHIYKQDNTFEKSFNYNER